MFLRYIIAVDRVVRWYRSARRHRVGKAHAMHVIASTEPMHVPASVTADARRVWIPNDDRGIELEIVALDLEDTVVVIQSCRQACGGDFMTTPTKYSLGPDIPAGESLRDGTGRIVDDPYVDAAVEEAIHRVRGRGRPSLSEAGESPLLRVRISRELDASVRLAAEAAGTSRSEWVRQALEKASRRAG